MKKIFIWALVFTMLISFMPTNVYADDYSATVIFTNGSKTVEKTFTDPNEVVGLQGFPGDTGVWIFKTYLAGWGTEKSLDLNNPDHNLYLTNTKISDIFPNGTTEPVTLYTYYIGLGNIALSKNKIEINKGMDGAATVPGAEIKDIERDDTGRLTKVIVYYDENKDSYELNLKANLEMEKNAAILSWMNPGGIFTNSGQQWGSVAPNAPYTHVDLDMTIDERIEMVKEMELHFRSYNFKHQHTIGELSTGRVGYKSLGNTISVNDPVNIRLADRKETKEEADLTEFKNSFIVRTSIRNDGNSAYHTRNATLDEIYKDMELYTLDSNFFKIPKELAEKIANKEADPIKITGKIYGNIRPGGIDTPIPEIFAQELVIDFATKVPETNEVKFDKNFPEGTETILSTVKVEKDSSINGDNLTDESMPANPAEFIQDGKKYTFREWNTKADGSGTVFTGDTVVTADMTVYAQWNSEDLPPNTVTVKFDKNDRVAPNIIKSVVIPKGSTVGNEMPANPERNAYTFLEWNTKSDGTGVRFTSRTIVDGDITVYAIWRRIDNDHVNPFPSNPGGTTPGSSTTKPLASGTDKVEIHNPYIKGYPDKTVKPEGAITRGETAAIFARLMGIEEGKVYESSYPDVKSTAWYANYIGYLSDKNILKGYPDGSFKPEEKITRAEYATIAASFAEKTGTTSFPDVVNHWAKENIEKVVAEGWIQGYPDGTYKPDQNISRAEAVKITNPIFKRYPDREFIITNEDLMPKFTDLKNNHWAYYELMEAAQGHQFIRIENEKEKWESLI